MTRIRYIPEDPSVWENYFNEQSVQHGRGLLGFRGSQYQRGSGIGSLLGGLFRSILPIAKNVGKTVGKQALRTATEVASDALSGRDVGEALEERAKTGAKKLLRKGVKKLDSNVSRKRKRVVKQKGFGLGTRIKSGSRTTVLSAKKRRALSDQKEALRDQLGAF